MINVFTDKPRSRVEELLFQLIKQHVTSNLKDADGKILIDSNGYILNHA